MNLDGIRKALGTRPFAPFALGLADGRSLDVPHPDFVSIGARLVVVVAPDNSWSIIEPLLIVSIDYSSPSSGSRSARNRRRPKK
jgi:hypothetical protein